MAELYYDQKSGMNYIKLTGDETASEVAKKCLLCPVAQSDRCQTFKMKLIQDQPL